MGYNRNVFIFNTGLFNQFIFIVLCMHNKFFKIYMSLKLPKNTLLKNGY